MGDAIGISSQCNCIFLIYLVKSESFKMDKCIHPNLSSLSPIPLL